MTVPDTFHLHKGHSLSLSLSLPLLPLTFSPTSCLLCRCPCCIIILSRPRLFDSRLIFIGNQVASSFSLLLFLYFSLLCPPPPTPVRRTPRLLQTHTYASLEQWRTALVLGDFFCQLGVLFNLISLFLFSSPLPPVINWTHHHHHLASTNLVFLISPALVNLFWTMPL